MADKKIQFEQPSNLLIFFNRFWIIITAILIGVLLLGGYYLVIQPKMNNNNDLRDNALQTSIDKQNSEQLLKNLETLETTYNGIKNNRQADLDRLKEIIPTNPQVAELFVLTDRLAKQYGLQLMDININDGQDKKNTTAPVAVSSEDETGAVTPVATTASTTSAKKALTLKNLTIDFKVTAIALQDELGNTIATDNTKTNYQLFKDFLDALERNLRLTDIQTVNFSSLQEDLTTAPQFQFTVQTYYK
jgi:hypothetical protein